MAVTQLDPKTALLVIDLQKGLMSFPTAHPIGNVVKLARQLLDAFRSHHLPVVLVNVAGGRARPHRLAAERGPVPCRILPTWCPS